MTMVSVIFFALWMVPIPMVIGSLFRKYFEPEGGPVFCWVAGQMLLWAVFQLLAIPLILRRMPFSVLVRAMLVMTALLLLYSVGIAVKNGSLKRSRFRVITGEKAWNKRMIFMAVLAAGLLLVQLVLTAVLAYEEGDDAYYLAVATSTVDSDLMYTKNPYQGVHTALDARHGLAPFPVWIAFLARISGMRVITLAQIALPMGLILMAYGIHYLMARKLFGQDQEKCILYLLLVEVLTIFGGHSSYTTESFLLVRISQGKAVLCNLVLPFLLLLFLHYLQRLQKEQRCKWVVWLLFIATSLSGCLCSTQGGLLVCMLLGLGGMCAAGVYKKWKHLIPLGISCTFPVIYLLLYLKLG